MGGRKRRRRGGSFRPRVTVAIHNGLLVFVFLSFELCLSPVPSHPCILTKDDKNSSENIWYNKK